VSYAVAIPTSEKDSEGRTIVDLYEASVFGLNSSILGLESEELQMQKSERVDLILPQENTHPELTPWFLLLLLLLLLLKVSTVEERPW